MGAVEKPFLTSQEYLGRERLAEFRSEYYRGETFAMAGTSRAHMDIVGNIYHGLRSRRKSKSCSFFFEQMRVKVSENGLYTYPDLAIVCGPELFEDAKSDTLLNPRIIVEVLSDSTESYDRKEKYDLYSDLESLEEYILVAQNQMRIERYIRQENGLWSIAVLTSPNEELNFGQPELSIPLSDIYADVSFPPQAATRPSKRTHNG